MKASAYTYSLTVLCLLLHNSDGRFAIKGPVLTLTLKDPSQAHPPSPLDMVEQLLESTPLTSTSLSTSPPAVGLPWLDLASLRPSLLWEIASLASPLPYWFPNLKQIKVRAGYQYTPEGSASSSSPMTNNNKAPISRLRIPSWIEGTAKFSDNLGELIVQPSYDLQQQRTTILLEASRGASWALARLGLANPHQILPHLETVRASIVLNLPYLSLAQLRCTPSYDVINKDLACQIEAVTGGYGRTRAVLNLEYQTPTLSVIHQLDSRNTIAPTINLYNARIIYQWNCLLGRTGLSSVRTKVDPTSAIEITWTDQSETGGSWVTDVKLPLEATSLQKLAADVRIRRQFRF